jgi:hypothetical protein
MQDFISNGQIGLFLGNLATSGGDTVTPKAAENFGVKSFK